MTKLECQELVRIAYAMYNLQILIADETHIFRAWYAMVGDLDYEAATDAFTELATYADFMPRPGEVRRKTIDMLDGGGRHPDGATAWGILQSMRKATEGGQFYEGDKPEALLEAIKLLGASVYDLHTNGDRETFLRVYNKVVEKLEQKKYKKSTGMTVVDEDA
jgi:hypothetical protein